MPSSQTHLFIPFSKLLSKAVIDALTLSRGVFILHLLPLPIHAHTHTPLLPVFHSSLNLSSTSLIHSFGLQLLIIFHIYLSVYSSLFSIASSGSVFFQILNDL